LHPLVFANINVGCGCISFDDDGDGVPNLLDNCPSDANPGQEDVDGDGVGDVCDNCVNDPNSDQSDIDGDGDGDVCDPDIDDDGAPNALDNCPFDFNDDQSDVDLDGVGDVCDNCPVTPNPDQTDSDDDGVGDACQDDFAPDLIIKNIRVTPLRQVHGQPVKVTFTVQNVGKSKSPSTTHTIMIGARLAARVVGPELKPKASKTISVTFPVPERIKAGQWVLKAKADYFRKMSELSRVNNSATALFTVLRQRTQ
jgi:hypothetical protein